MVWNLADALKNNSDTLVLPVGKTIPWRHNGSRAVSTGLARAYYAAFIEKIEILYLDQEIRIYIQALGEWDLPNPASSLFCILDPANKDETWAQLAHDERRNMSKSNNNTPSRFFLAEWVDDYAVTALANGFYKGCLCIPMALLLESFASSAGRSGLVRRHLNLSFGSSIPWKNDYAIAPILELEIDLSTKEHEFSIPLTSRPVSPDDPWSPVFPADVLARFLERFQK